MAMYGKLTNFEQICRGQNRQASKDDNRYRAVYDMYQDAEGKEVETWECNSVRSKVFHVHSIRSVIIAKLKTKSSQGIDTCEYKTDKGVENNLISIKV